MRMTVQGVGPLRGEVQVQASKNAGQKIIPALVSFCGVVELPACSLVGDNRALLGIIDMLGGMVDISSEVVRVDTRQIRSVPVPRQTTMKTTGSFILSGSLLARFGKATIGAPGGDELGPRPVDFHLDAFEAMGVRVERHGDEFDLSLDHPQPVDYTFENKTANGTVNACILASAIDGTSVFRNVDYDPDIENFVNFMKTMGVDISYRLLEKTIVVDGKVDRTASGSFEMLRDRNDAVTLICAVSASGGDAVIRGVPAGVGPAIEVLRNMGVVITESDGTLRVDARSPLSNVSAVVSDAFPGFSTDWGPMLQAVMTQSAGVVHYTETVFSYRFSQVAGLKELGASVDLVRDNSSDDLYRFEPDGMPHTVVVNGPTELVGTQVTGRDIRGAAALLIAAIASRGESTLHGAEHIVRGYEDLPLRLRQLGARCSDPV